MKLAMQGCDPEDLNEVPSVQDGLVDGSTLDALLRDWTCVCRLVEVRTREDGAHPAWPANATGLTAAVARLRGGQTAGLQIRYVYEGDTWCDTLMPISEGLRLVRIRQPAG